MLSLLYGSTCFEHHVLIIRRSKLYYRASGIITLKQVSNSVPLQAWTGPEGSRKLRFPDFMTTAQDGGRLSALRTVLAKVNR